MTTTSISNSLLPSYHPWRLRHQRRRGSSVRCAASALPSKCATSPLYVGAFKVYDLNEDGFITQDELFSVLKLMVGKNLSEDQLQSIARTTLQKADKDKDGKISFEEFSRVRASRPFRMQHHYRTGSHRSVPTR